MTTIGRNLLVKGEVRTTDDLTIEGRIEGHVFGENCTLVLAEGSDVQGDVLATDVTILGKLSGQVMATDVVDIRLGSTVAAQVMSKRFILEEGARFDGRVEPQHLEAAIRVAKFQQKKRDAGERQGDAVSVPRR